MRLLKSVSTAAALVTRPRILLFVNTYLERLVVNVICAGDNIRITRSLLIFCLAFILLICKWIISYHLVSSGQIHSLIICRSAPNVTTKRATYHSQNTGPVSAAPDGKENENNINLFRVHCSHDHFTHDPTAYRYYTSYVNCCPV